VWKSRTPRTSSRHRLPTGIALLVTLVLGVISWNAKGRDRRPPHLPVAEAPQPPESGEFIEGAVVGVADGDTVTVLDASNRKYKIRLLGIDAPEKAQPFGKVAKQVLSDRIFEKRVRVQVKAQDRYGRTLGKVLLDGVDINLEMLKEGLVWHYKHYADSQFPGDAERYAQAEVAARSARIGLWDYPNPMEPWNWRQEQKRSSRR
jgi:endonuclease YncB( thermonuclease family)